MRTRSLSTESIERIEAVLSAAVPVTDGPGLASIVMLDGEIVHSSCRGVANLEQPTPITPQTTFHIASMSKQFAAFALALLAERGQLDLDGDLRGLLPYVPDLGARITPRQLAHHTSGLRDQWGMLLLSGWRIDDVITTDDVIGVIERTRALNFAPQTGFSYSNAGYTLMGEIVRAVDGRSLREFCAQEIFEPLGMTSTHFHDNYREVVPGRTYSYLPLPDGGFQHSVLSYSVVGATSLHTTVEDLALWDRNFESRAIGSDSTWEVMHSSGVLLDGTATGYSFGLMHDQVRGHRRVHHSGGDAGFRTQGERYPELGLSVYVLCNLGTLQPTALSRQLADIVMDEVGVEPAVAAVASAISQPQRYAGSFINPHTGYTLEIALNDDGVPCIMGAPLAETAPDELALATSVSLRFSGAGDLADAVAVTMTAMAPQRLERYEPVAVSPDELAEYEGSFWSDEVEALYRVRIVDGSLVLVQRKLERMTLTPSTRDSFRATTSLGWSFAVVFDRDASGAISGLRLSMPRIDNVSLRRTGD